MNEILAKAYGTDELTGGAVEVEKTAEAAMLDELVKIAEDNNIDLSELSDEDIVEVLQAAQYADTEKVAEDAGYEYEDENEKLASAIDFAGRQLAHSFYSELHAIGESAMNKQASEDLDNEAIEVANQILEAASAAFPDEAEKTSSLQDALLNKVAETQDEDANDAVLDRALELLDAEGYDLDLIAEALNQ